MTTLRSVFQTILLSLGGLALASPMWAADRAQVVTEPMTLQVQVNIPPSWQPLLEDDVSEMFVHGIREVFRQQGYQGRVVEVRRFEQPSPGCCLLTINLIEWRMRHTGTVDCTFTATLQTEETSRNLGVFSGMAFHWRTASSRVGLARAFDDAAVSAIRDLHSHLARTELVPGLRPRG